MPCLNPKGYCDQRSCEVWGCPYDEKQVKAYLEPLHQTIEGRKMNEQEKHWAGPDGDQYHTRSPGDEDSNFHFFRKALACAEIKYNTKIIELGCGTGANLRALRRIYPAAELAGVELSRTAIAQIPEDVRTTRASVLDWEPDDEYVLAFTKGLLIHIAPDDLPKAYKALVEASNRYVLVAEYFCPTPRMIPYRGQDDRLWARDFGGEIMDAHGLKLVDYGFVSKRDIYPQDGVTWMLMEKP